MYEKIISSILVVSLLNLVGCYSSNYITTQELNSIKNLGEVEITTTDSINYSFERFTNTQRMFNAPNKYYYEDWMLADDSLFVLAYSFNEMNINVGYQLKKDTLLIPFSDMEQIIVHKLDTTNTILLIAIPIIMVGIVLIVIYNSEWDIDVN